MAKVPSPRFSSLMSLWRSNSQLSSLQELAPLLFTLCKEFHVSFVSLHCTSATGLGLGYCRNKSSVACPERTSTVFSQFPIHKHCCVYHNMPTSLLTLWFPTLCHPKPWNHFISLQYSVHWEHETSVRKRVLQKNFREDDSEATSFAYIAQSQESFQTFALERCFQQRGGSLNLLSPICKMIISGISF